MTITSSKDLDHYFGNIDLAICNHIHTAVGQVKIPSCGRTVPMFIPGSLCITKNQPSELHSETMLPVVTLEDDGLVRVSLAKFSLHMEMLKLYKKKETKSLEEEANNISQKDISEILGSRPTASLKETLISKGYNSSDLQIVDEAALGILNLDRALMLAGGT